MYMDDSLEQDFYIEMCTVVVSTPLNDRLGLQGAALAGFAKKQYRCI